MKPRGLKSIILPLERCGRTSESDAGSSVLAFVLGAETWQTILSESSSEVLAAIRETLVLLYKANRRLRY